MTDLTFKKLKINSNILKALDEMGFSRPTEIQEKAIPALTETDKDFVGQAQTGTGKTAAFSIPLLDKINEKDSSVQALILAPTRELAMQVEKEIQKIGKYMNVRSTCVYGGTGYDKQIRSLKRGKAQVVVGTPGRVIDLIEKGILKLDSAKFCVLDEADEMLNMGFFEDVQMILDLFREDRQLIMFSATMPKAIMDLIRKSFRKYEMVKIEKKSLSNDDIEQKYFIVKNRYFKESLARLIEGSPDVYGLIFCRTKLETKEVGEDLRQRGHSVEVLNGDMGQNERDYAMRNFKEKKVRLMVCTDVAARGIDVTNLTHVFNYGLPQDNESYVHRIGRTGRAGMKGAAYTIVGPKTAFAIKKIEKHINKKITPAKLPSVDEIIQRLVKKEVEGAQQIAEAIQTKGREFEVDGSFEILEESFGSFSKEELLKLIFTWKFNKTLRHYKNLPDIEHTPSMRDSEPRTRNSRRRRRFSKSGGGSRDRASSNRGRDNSGGRDSRSRNGKRRSTRSSQRGNSPRART